MSLHFDLLSEGCGYKAKGLRRRDAGAEVPGLRLVFTAWSFGGRAGPTAGGGLMGCNGVPRVDRSLRLVSGRASSCISGFGFVLAWDGAQCGDDTLADR
jgi:hypothetical protein